MIYLLHGGMMEIYLDRVQSDKKDTLYRLLEYSLFEESLHDGNEMNDDAIFEYQYFDSYFTDNDRDAFFIRENKTNKLLGFVRICKNFLGAIALLNLWLYQNIGEIKLVKKLPLSVLIYLRGIGKFPHHLEVLQRICFGRM